MIVPEPMLAKDLRDQVGWSGDDPLAGVERWLTPERRRLWTADLKRDGDRTGLVIGADGSQFGTFDGDRTASFPDFARIAIPGLDGTAVDGEFMLPTVAHLPAPRRGGATGWFNSMPPHAAKLRAKYKRPPRLCLFDVTAINGQDVTRKPYSERRDLLELVCRWVLRLYPACGVELMPALPAEVGAIRQALLAGHEGVVFKRLAGPYQAGIRSGDWLKFKQFSRVDCVLTGGYKPGKNSREGTVGAVELAVTEDDGTLVVVGHCAVKPAQVCAYTDPATGGLRPELAGVVWEVEVQGLGPPGEAAPYGKFVHPHFIGERPHKDTSTAQLAALRRI